MGILFGFIFIGVAFLMLAGFVGGVIWLYRKFFQPKDPAAPALSKPNFLQHPLEFPSYFGWALALVLVGFHIGIYAFVTYTGWQVRVPAAGWAVFGLFSAIAFFFLLIKQRHWFIYSTLVLSFLAGLWLFLRANGFVQTWNIIFFVLSHFLLFIVFVKGRLLGPLGSWLGAGFSLIPISFIQGLRVLGSVFRKDVTHRAAIFGWLKTGTIALIVLAIFLSLLSQADPVFAEVVREFRSQLVGRAIWTIVITFVAAAIWTISLKSETPEKETSISWLSYRDITAVLGVVVTVVAVFLAVQFKYLFGGSTDLLKELNLTFSEYVRKGFTELLVAVFIGGVLSYMAGVKARVWSGTERRTSQILNSVMLIELGLLLVSAFQRDLLYVETYGLTRVRVMGEVFLAWLAFFLTVLMVFGWHKIKEKVAVASLWIGAVLVLVSINVMNVDLMVARGAPGHHEYTDYFYLMQLSEDAAPVWPELLAQIESDTERVLAKGQLTPEDKAQLAGLKLATISFIENRDQLYLKYASDEWLLQNAKLIGLELPDKTSQLQQYNDGNWQNQRGVLETLYPTSGSQITWQEKMIPESLEKYRGWQFTNNAERRAFLLISSLNGEAFETPRRILTDILQYQVRNQVSLGEQERRLLYDLKYQFITVQLKRYYINDLHTLDLRNTYTIPSYVSDELKGLEKSNQWSVNDLSQLSCEQAGSLPTPLTVYGVASKESVTVSKTEPGETKLFSIRPFDTTLSSPPTIQVFTPAGLKIEMINTTGIETSMKVPSQANYDYMPPPVSYMPAVDESSSTFVRATLRADTIDQDGKCTVVFTGDKLEAYQGF